MTLEDEIALLLSVSVSDVAPHNDHAGRALASRRTRILKRRTYAGGAAFVAIAAVVFSAVARFPGRDATAASVQWERQITLDGGQLRIEPPEAGDVMSVSDEEARAVVRRIRPESGTTVIASRWGRVTVSGQDGRPLLGFDDVVAWATVFRRGVESNTCPGAVKAPVAAVDPGEFAETQVLVMTGEGAQAIYSQAGSWLCGLPAVPVASLPESVG